ncbi:hypothetical protein KDK_73080 [Dictyobacter kobayashii]|uniref:Uncharacterized protein n=1 Tax=Dictyobacter kobayashii TaxID=2014872 RepID=A0A402AWP0_9CHLR|nr:hypothetical protein KDK_73080 [Dictyobacter kobayashii]
MGMALPVPGFTTASYTLAGTRGGRLAAIDWTLLAFASAAHLVVGACAIRNKGVQAHME